MGSICPCFNDKKSQEKKNTEKAHQIVQIMKSNVIKPSETIQKIQVMPTQPNTATNIIKTVIQKGKEQIHKHEGVIQEKKVIANKYIKDHLQQNQETPQGGSVKSIIRKHLNNVMNQNNTGNQSLQNLQNTHKVVSTIYNKDRKITIKSCKRSSIFIFDTSQDIEIDKCFDTLVFCAPCSGKISINNCRQLRLVSISLNILIKNSKLCQLSLFCSNPPVLVNSNDIVFSNYLRIGYFQMIQHLSRCNLEIWNNSFLDVHDQDQRLGQRHYQIKKMHNFDIQWTKALEQGAIEPADPIIPLVWRDSKTQNKRKIFLLNQPMRQIQYKLLKYIVSNNICIEKSFKGVLPNNAFSKMKKLFPNHEQNLYMCFIIGKQLDGSGFEAYFDVVQGQDAEELQSKIFSYPKNN